MECPDRQRADHMTNGVLVRKSGKKFPRLPLVDRDAHRRQKTEMLARQTSEDERQQPFGLGISHWASSTAIRTGAAAAADRRC